MHIQLLQVFDSWANELSEHDFMEFSFPTLKRIATGVRAKLAAQQLPAVSIILFAKGANLHLDTLANETDYSLAAALWTKDVNLALNVGARIKSGQCIQ